MSYQNSQINNPNNIPDIDIRKIPPDKPLAVTVAFLVVIGLMIIFSASAQKCIDMGYTPLRFFIQQLLGVGAGVVGAYFLSNYNYKNYKNKSFIFAIIVIILLHRACKSSAFRIGKTGNCNADGRRFLYRVKIIYAEQSITGIYSYSYNAGAYL